MCLNRNDATSTLQCSTCSVLCVCTLDLIIIIIVDLSSVSWSRDHIGDALIDNGIGPSPPKQGAKKASQEGGVMFVSRAGYPLSSPRGRVVYGERDGLLDQRGR